MTPDQSCKSDTRYFLPGFEESATALNQAVRANLTSYGPKHEHKIAGVGYLISKAMRFEVAA